MYAVYSQPEVRKSLRGKKLLTRFNSLTYKHTIIRKEFSLNFLNITYTITDSFGKKSAIGTRAQISGIWGLNSYGSILTFFRLDMSYLKCTIVAIPVKNYLKKSGWGVFLTRLIAQT